jgi:hypothetical protein
MPFMWRTFSQKNHVAFHYFWKNEELTRIKIENDGHTVHLTYTVGWKRNFAEFQEISFANFAEISLSRNFLNTLMCIKNMFNVL